MYHNRPCPDPRIVPNANPSQDFCAGPYDHIIPQSWVPFASFVSGTPKGHILINQRIIAYLGGLTYNYAHAVVDKKAAADFRAWVDFNSGEEAGELRDHAWQQGYIGVVEPVGEAVEQDRVEPGIAQENLKDALGGRVFAKYGVDLFPDCAKHKKRPLM